ncbi:hypothetical protein EKN38_22285 [Enterobacter sp. WCHEn045836]|uniref:hypothetical protein n=1 Tax=Enterobacter sp. WCHEn045836 TaxID=2497434 RepID=UPI000F8292F4|nr:hypothetical protein [Enterobacter sp. WCHEn045836]RTP97274.1 hypothetical protein EKN38_22285 [Enterobacter sp. WCHEn045836]
MIKIPHKRLPAALMIFSFLLIVMIALLYVTEWQRRLVLSCSFDISFYDSENDTDLKKNTHLYYYSDGTGFRTEKGLVDQNNIRYYIDRDIHFTYADKDRDGTFTLEYTQVYKREHDNLPKDVWGTGSTPGTKFYFSLSEIAPELYLFRERGTPVMICPSVISP